MTKYRPIQKEPQCLSHRGGGAVDKRAVWWTPIHSSACYWPKDGGGRVSVKHWRLLCLFNVQFLTSTWNWGMQREHDDLRQVRPMTSNPNNGDKTKINMLNGHAWIATATHHFIHTCKTYAMHEQWADAIECTLMQVLLDNINQSIVIIIYPLRCLPERRENWCLDGNQAK